MKLKCSLSELVIYGKYQAFTYISTQSGFCINRTGGVGSDHLAYDN